MGERRVALLCALLAAVGPISLTLYTPALPAVAAQLGAPVAEVQLSISWFFAGLAIAQLLCGPLADALGRRPVLLFFLAIYVAGSALAMRAEDVDALVTARLFQGVGAAAGIALSRAIVRDLFTGVQAVRILALVSMVFAVGPALAPTLGGVLLALWGWRALFVAMLLLGIGVAAICLVFLRETVSRDLTRLRLGEIARTYGRIARSPSFLLPTLILANTNGVVYAQATILPFVMIDEVGLSPQAFGASMLVQTVPFFLASLLVRRLVALVHPARLLGLGLGLFLAGSAALPLLALFHPPSWPTVMGPIAVSGLAIAFTMPTAMASGLAPFPQHAGAAAAVMGFLQMGIGLCGGVAAILFPQPSMALVVISPAMALVAVASFVLWRSLPTGPSAGLP